jgi:hypothetical protein
MHIKLKKNSAIQFKILGSAYFSTHFNSRVNNGCTVTKQSPICCTFLVSFWKVKIEYRIFIN